MKTTYFRTVKLKKKIEKKIIVLLRKKVCEGKSKKKNGATITQRRYNAYQSDTNFHWLDHDRD